MKLIKQTIVILMVFATFASSGAADPLSNGIVCFKLKDYTCSFENFNNLAAQNDPKGQYYLALLYYYGKGAPKDLNKSVEWLEKSANQNFPPAETSLGMMYQYYVSDAEKKKSYLAWLERGAKHNDPEAFHRLGKIYWTISRQDYKKAFDYFKQGAEYGNFGAQLSLAKMYEHGSGVAKNNEEAFNWTKRAADQHLIDAELRLALCYANGIGTEKQPGMALDIYKRLASAGVREAQLFLGVGSWQERGVTPFIGEILPMQKDYVEAYKWFVLSGMEDGRDQNWTMMLKKNMTPEQITEAKERIKNWAPIYSGDFYQADDPFFYTYKTVLTVN